MAAVRRTPLTAADRAEWAAYARQITPLDRRAVPEPPEAPPVVTPQPSSTATAAPAPPLPATRPSLPPVSVGHAPPGVDNATWNKLQAGRIPTARTLDLHGRTAQRAYHALHAFLTRAHADRLRCVEIITGRGSGEDGGVLRRELPIWLNLPELRPLVLAAAHPHAANPGAVRVLLRRVR